MAENRSLSEIIKDVNKKFGKDIMSEGVENLVNNSTLSLGSPSLDFCLYNSFPENRIIEFCGAESSGKTSLAYIVAGAYQRKERERHPDNPRSILFVDLECGVDPLWARKFGYDMNCKDVPTIRATFSDMPAEYIFDTIIDCVKSREVGLVIIDSLNMLVPLQVYNESLEKKDMGGVAKPLGDFVRRITSLLIKYQCTLIGINQLRENISGYGNPLITSGGRGWKHGCTLRLMVKRGDFVDSEGNKLKTSAESPAGYIMEVAVLKTKVCKWDRKLGLMHINYDKGCDFTQDTIDVATYFGLIDNSVQGTYRLLDPDTGEALLDETGKEIKIRGVKNVKPYFETHPELYKKVYDKVYEKLSVKENPTVVAFENMLNMNVNERFGIDLDKEE